MGLGHTLIGPHNHANILLQPQLAFHPHTLVIPKELLNWALLTELRIVGKSMSISPESLAQERVMFSGPCAQPNDWLLVSVTNNSDSTQAFMGTIVGRMPK
jgi:hypothetical protein